MHRKYSKQGMTAISVNLDDPKDAETMDSVREFLTEEKATFPAVVLDEKPEVWQEKLGILGYPAVFVFGKDGRLAKKFDNISAEVDYKEIEKLVVQLLKKK